MTMRHTAYIIALMAVALSTQAQSLRLSVSISNDWDKAKTDEPVVIRLKELKQLKFNVVSASVRKDNTTLPCQLDDLDGDTYADELIFLIDHINSHEKQTYSIELSGSTNLLSQQPTAKPRVYADLLLDDKKSKYPHITSLEAPGESYLYNDIYHHGAAFESELTAFRVYFDQRQNIDIYGKKLRRLELADTHFYTTPAQMQQDYGNDVLWAGNSIGCGSFKGWDGQAPANIEPVRTRGQRIIAAGPLRTVVEVKALGWNGLNMRQYYILYGGHRECEVQVCFDHPLGNETFSTGVQKIGQSPKGFVRADGIAASWGSDYPEMGNKEQFPPETVGLAVYVPTEYISNTTESDLNYLFTLQAKGRTSLHYYVTFCADKEADGYHTANAWFDSLAAWQSALQHPCSVSIKTIK